MEHPTTPNSQHNRFIPEVEEVLRQAGWFPGRKVPEAQIEVLNQVHPLFPAARRVFEEFYGIYVESTKSLTGAVLFVYTHPDYRPPFCIDPAMDPNGAFKVNLDSDIIKDYERVYGFKLYPLGFHDYTIDNRGRQPEMFNGYEIVIDESGRVFLSGHGEFVLAGNNFDRALHNLILKVASQDGGMCEWDWKRNAPADNPST